MHASRVTHDTCSTQVAHKYVAALSATTLFASICGIGSNAYQYRSSAFIIIKQLKSCYKSVTARECD